eukprot:PhF_6_TR26295/c3_g2_i3/m.37712
MLSLINLQTESIQSNHFPQDCINHILSYCDTPTASVAYLVCRSWYHAVDRYVCLGDTFYNLPESFQPQKPRRFPSGSLHTLQTDIRLQETEVVYVDTIEVPPETFAQPFTSCR